MRGSAVRYPLMVARARARLGSDADGRGRPRLWCIGIALAASCLVGVDLADASTAARPTPPHPASWRSLDGPRVAVAGAAGVVVDGRAALVGGFTDRLEATAAVQIRDPRHGWMPVGTALLEARAEATPVPLEDGSVLVVGGWSGRLPDQTVPLGTVERCDPWNPQFRRAVPAPWPDRAATGLDGHAACRLPDGRVMLVHDRDGVVFDPTDDTWGTRFTLATPRRRATMIALAPAADGTLEVLVVGGTRTSREPAIESIRCHPDSTVTTIPWRAESLPSTVTGLAAIRFGDEVILAGGLLDDRSLDRTWRLTPARQSVEPGPPLPIEGGITGASLIRHGRRLVLIGGERRDAGRPLPVAHGAVLRSDLGRVWALPAGPQSAVRAAVLTTPSAGSIEIVGGYRFDATAARGARTRVLDLDTRLDLPRLLVED